MNIKPTFSKSLWWVIFMFLSVGVTSWFVIPSTLLNIVISVVVIGFVFVMWVFEKKEQYKEFWKDDDNRFIF